MARQGGLCAVARMLTLSSAAGEQPCATAAVCTSPAEQPAAAVDGLPAASWVWLGLLSFWGVHAMRCNGIGEHQRTANAAAEWGGHRIWQAGTAYPARHPARGAAD